MIKISVKVDPREALRRGTATADKQQMVNVPVTATPEDRECVSRHVFDSSDMRGLRLYQTSSELLPEATWSALVAFCKQRDAKKAKQDAEKLIAAKADLAEYKAALLERHTIEKKRYTIIKRDGTIGSYLGDGGIRNRGIEVVLPYPELPILSYKTEKLLPEEVKAVKEEAAPWIMFLSDERDAICEATRPQLEANEATCKRLKAEKEAHAAAVAAAKEKDKVDWINEYGSVRLKKLLTEQIEYGAVYQDERLAHDLPGWSLWGDEYSKHADARNAPLAALEMLDEARSMYTGDKKALSLTYVRQDDNTFYVVDGPCPWDDSYDVVWKG